MECLPNDLYSYIAGFLEPYDLRHFHITNKLINKNPLVRKQIFRLRLEKSINCRLFLPTETAKQNWENFKETMPSNSVADVFLGPLKLGNQLIGNKHAYIINNNNPGRSFFGYTLILPNLSLHVCNDESSILKKIIDLYPYDNLSKENFYCSYRGCPFVIVSYDKVPEKYITIEQADHDIIVYYKILKERLLL